MSRTNLATVPKSTLLHTSLAYLSPELTTIDAVIHARRTVLPTEILLLVRDFLLPTVTAQLIRRSTFALVAYEQSLRELLCADCIAYNHDIYGPDVWQWDQFNGACACRESAASALPRSKQAARAYIVPPSHGTLNPKQYTDSSHWLECYLSREAAGYRPTTSSSAESPTHIWSVVDAMLRDYDCEAVWDPEDAARARSHNRIVRRQFHFQRDVVQICARRPQGTDALVPDLTDDARAQAVLHRGVRELGLLRDYTREYRAYAVPVVPAGYLRWPGAPGACCGGRDAAALAGALVRFAVSLALGCLSMPITFATLAVTVFCFYSRPRGFRVF